MDLLPFGPGMRPDKRLAAPQRPSFAEALRFWFKLGWISFGGTCASPKFCAHRKKHEFPGATAVPSRFPFTCPSPKWRRTLKSTICEVLLYIVKGMKLNTPGVLARVTRVRSRITPRFRMSES